MNDNECQNDVPHRIVNSGDDVKEEMVVEQKEDDVPSIVSKALECAKYNESVTLTLGGGSGTEYVLVAKLDKVNGGIQWNPLSQCNDDDITTNTNDPTDSKCISNSCNDLLIRRHVRTKQWIWPMLQDSKRNELYRKAIERASSTTTLSLSSTTTTTTTDQLISGDSNKHYYKALDIGSGTGLLAMMVSHYFNLPQNETTRTTTVQSLEMSSPMAQLARRVIAYNHTNQKQTNNKDDNVTSHPLIHIAEQHSFDYVPPTVSSIGEPAKKKKKVLFQICTSELLESGLVGEGLIPTMKHAWNHLLTPDALVIPQRARVFCQILEGPISISSYNNKSHHSQFQYSCTQNNNDNNHNRMIPIQGKALLNQSDVTILSKPIANILELDWSYPTSPTLSGTNISKTISIDTINDIVQSGTAHGLLIWWELDLFQKQDTDLIYSTTPHQNDYFQDHWQQCLYVLEQPLKIQTQNTNNSNSTNRSDLHLTTLYDEKDLKLSFQLYKNINDNDDHHVNGNSTITMPSHSSTRQTSESLHSSHPSSWLRKKISIQVSPERIYQLNRYFHNHNSKQKLIYLQAIQSILYENRRKIKQSSSNKHSNMVILDLSDGCTCAELALLSITNSTEYDNDTETRCRINFVSLESNAQEAELSRSRLQQFHSHKNTNISILHMYPEHIQRQHLIEGGDENKDNDDSNNMVMVLTEPYLHILDGWPILQALNHYYTMQSLYRKQVLQPYPRTQCVPHQARIMACVVQFETFHKAYQKSLDNLCHPYWDHHHPIVESFWNENDMPVSMWQHPHTRLTDPFCLSQLSYDQYNTKTPSQDDVVRVSFVQSGICHALVTWVEYGFHSIASMNNESSRVSTRNTLSTWNNGYKQSVRMFPKYQTVDSTKHLFLCQGFFLNCDNPEEDYEINFHFVNQNTQEMRKMK